MRFRACVFGLMMLCAPLAALGDAPPAKNDRGDGFPAFCGQWMRKLSERERANLANAKEARVSGRVVLEYTGYANEPLSCNSRVKQPGRPGVGVLVYHELHYRRSGATNAEARANDPEVVEKIEVTEVFRYDGSRWSY